MPVVTYCDGETCDLSHELALFLRDEELTRYTVTSGFETELNNGQLELTVVNGSERAWKNLPKVWDYLHEEEQFTDYVQKEIQRFLKKRSEQ